MPIGVGFSLAPQQQFLELLEEVIREEPDYYEVAPETCWTCGEDGVFVPNGYHRVFQEMQQRSGKPFVAHGVGYSVGTAKPDPVRQKRWLDRIEQDHATFAFEWYTDHLGTSVLDGEELLLPLGLPYTPDAADRVAESLAQLQTIVPHVGVENSVFYFHLGDPLAEPEWLGLALQARNTHLLLDLHNVHTTALNVGFDPKAYIDKLPLEKVIEIHVAGGSWSEPAWLPDGRSMRLDSHEAAVPEEVWGMLESVLPRCPNLRGVTLERMEGTVIPGPPGDSDVDRIREELQRIRQIIGAAHA